MNSDELKRDIDNIVKNVVVSIKENQGRYEQFFLVRLQLFDCYSEFSIPKDYQAGELLLNLRRAVAGLGSLLFLREQD